MKYKTGIIYREINGQETPIDVEIGYSEAYQENRHPDGYWDESGAGIEEYCSCVVLEDEPPYKKGQNILNEVTIKELDNICLN